MSKKLTTSEFQDRLNSIYGEQFVVIDEYINNETPIHILCRKCNNIIIKKPVKMTGSEKSGCYICNKKNPYKNKQYLQNELDNRYPNEFEVIEEYVNARTPILMRRKCGHLHRISPDNALRGKGCPFCGIRQSSYMNIVEQYLNDNHIEYEKEKRFENCKFIRILPFDYYLPKYNTCIEVDGEFHFPRKFNSTTDKENYDLLIIRDNIKTKFCNDNNIILIRLPYYDSLIFENILNKKLHVNTETTLAI